MVFNFLSPSLNKALRIKRLVTPQPSDKRKTVMHIIALFMALVLSGCQLSAPTSKAPSTVEDNATSVDTATSTAASPAQVSPTITPFDYSYYYVWLKTLAPDELLAEITKQKQGSEDPNNHTHYIKLMLLHSLPRSPIYQPYNAKTILNQYPILISEISNIQNQSSNLGFVLLLKDQLNAQIRLIQKRQQHTRLQQEKLTEQALQINQLTRQLTQLKKIEKTINQHSL